MPETYEITKEHRRVQRLSLREFADEINKDLINTSVTHATINRWENEERTYEPDMRLLFECLSRYRDWRAAWASACLKAMWPYLFSAGILQVNLPNGGDEAKS